MSLSCPHGVELGDICSRCALVRELEEGIMLRLDDRLNRFREILTEGPKEAQILFQGHKLETGFVELSPPVKRGVATRIEKVPSFFHGATVEAQGKGTLSRSFDFHYPVKAGMNIIVWGAKIVNCYVGQEMQSLSFPLSSPMVVTSSPIHLGVQLTLELQF